MPLHYSAVLELFFYVFQLLQSVMLDNRYPHGTGIHFADKKNAASAHPIHHIQEDTDRLFCSQIIVYQS